MKSTKKIFVVAIAALMLFAFTACNNTVPSVYNGVVSAEVQQVKGYFNGEEVAEDGFQIVVNYAEGEPRIIKGNKGTIELDGNIANAAFHRCFIFWFSNSCGNDGGTIVISHFLISFIENRIIIFFMRCNTCF